MVETVYVILNCNIDICRDTVNFGENWGTAFE